MLIAKIKAKNQITLPQAIVDSLHLRPSEFMQIDVKANYIRLIPVSIEPRYTQDELHAIDHLVGAQKNKAKTIKPGKDFSRYIKKISK